MKQKGGVILQDFSIYSRGRERVRQLNGGDLKTLNLTFELLSTNNVHEDGTNMKKCIRATDIVARLIEARPDWESYEELARRAGLISALTPKILEKRGDLGVGLLYRICKAFGYQVIVFNPNPPRGLEKAYVVGEEKSPVTPRVRPGSVHVSRDPYNNQLFRSTRRYKKGKRFTKVI